MAETLLSIGMAGDVMIGRLVNEHLDSASPPSIWGNLLPLLKSTDLNLINLEAALTRSENRVPKTFHFKADPEKVQVLIEGSIDVVNLANNHVLDYSEAGLIETLQTLDEARIQHVGAGVNFSSAISPVILTRKGVKIGILGCTDNEPTWKASASKPGIFFLEVGDLEAIRESILSLRSKVDLVILSIHWGPNMRERPSQEFREFAHRLIDLGVDLIHGHSAHLFQGIEVYRGKCILYDTGDFVDDYAVDPYLRNDRSFFFIAHADKQGIHAIRLTAVRISNFQVNQARGQEALEIVERMRALSKELGTSLEKEKDELILRL